MPQFPDLLCAGPCGQMIWRGRTSLPEGQAKCRPCRNLESKPKRAWTNPKIYRGVCAREGCDNEFETTGKSQKCCSRTCGQLHRFGTQPKVKDGWRTKRETLMIAAPGLTDTQRRRLRAKWIKRRTPCFYCHTALGVTLDHVVPISRGGTHYIGNLVPCCKKCNSGKQDRTIMEWRLGKSAPHTQRPIIRELRAVRQPKTPKPKPVPHVCDLIGCATATTRKRFCSDACSREWHNRAIRDRYRLAAGLPTNPAEPTWARSDGPCPICTTPCKRMTCSAECHDEVVRRRNRDASRVRAGLEPRGMDVPTRTWLKRRAAKIFDQAV